MRPLFCFLFAALPAVLPAQTPDASPNPYRLDPFYADFPVTLTYPNAYGREYDRNRRQMFEQLVSNLQGNVRREAWLMATEYFWRAPEEAIEPLIAQMDRWFSSRVHDVVRNCVEAMGKMGDERFDGALQRALEHPGVPVRQAALGALCRSGKPATLRAMERHFVQMDGRARGAWLMAVSKRLPEHRGEILARQWSLGHAPAVRDQILHAVMALPANERNALLHLHWETTDLELKAVLAAGLHAGGDEAGTAWLHDGLTGTELPRLLVALKYLTGVELLRLRSQVLVHSTHARSDVRLALARCLRGVSGEDIADVYEVLAGSEEVLDTREIALAELTARQRGSAVASMLEDLTTATGTRMQLLLHLLAKSGDGRAVAPLVERMSKAPATERRPFLQALAVNNSALAATALLDLFAGPMQIVGETKEGVHTTLNYLPTLLLNLRGHEAQMLERYRALPPTDYAHRAALLTTLAGLAADREDAALRQRCGAELRAVLFAASEVPQLRVLALNLLTQKELTVDDALQLKRMRLDESPSLRQLFADFLNEYF